MEQNTKPVTLEDLSKRADEAYVKLIKEDKVKDLLKTLGKFSDQNPKNAILIADQFPNATCVKRMDNWNFYKRSINKNEKSIKVIAHYITKNENDFSDEYGNTYTKSTEKLSVKVGHVFDISQTNGRDYPYVNTNKENVCKHFESAKKALEDTVKDFTVEYSDINTESNTNFESKKITIKDGLTLETTLDSLIKEVSKVLVNTRSRDGFMGIDNEEFRDIESKCVHYSVCSKTGLDLPDVDLSSISKMSDQDIELFKDNVNLIRSCSHQMISNFENAIERSVRELDKKEKELEKEKEEKTADKTEEKAEQPAKKTTRTRKSKTKESEAE